MTLGNDMESPGLIAFVTGSRCVVCAARLVYDDRRRLTWMLRSESTTAYYVDDVTCPRAVLTEMEENW